MFSSTRFVPFRLYRFLGPVWISGQYGWWLAALDVNWTIVMVLVSSIWLSLAKERGVVVGARGSCHPNACMHECTAGAPAESEIGRLRQTQLLRAKAFVMMFNCSGEIGESEISMGLIAWVKIPRKAEPARKGPRPNQRKRHGEETE